MLFSKSLLRLLLLIPCVLCATLKSKEVDNITETYETGSADESTNNIESNQDMNLQETGLQLFEQGRTLVHNSLKRFMIILPAIFFKLGIAFTLLILITLVAVNNGFIGFLLLVVGVSSVLARLQESRKPNVVPIISPISSYPSHHHVWDRSDNIGSEQDNTKQLAYSAYSPQYTTSLNSPNAYYGKFASISG